MALLPEMTDNDTRERAIQDMTSAMKAAPDRRMHLRYQVILMVLHRVSYEEICALTGCSCGTVRNYVKAYREGGIDGLAMGHSTGRPRKLTPEQEKHLFQTVVDKTPFDVGFPACMNWTSPIIRSWIKQEFAVSYSDRGTRELLYHLKLSFTVPTYTLAKADPIKQEEFKVGFDDIKKKLLDGEIDRILFQDESMIRDYQAICKTWFAKGQQKIIPTFGKHQGAKTIATLDYDSGDVFCVQKENYNAETFLNFLVSVVTNYAGERIVMVLDNARIHHAKLIQPFLEANKDRLTLHYLPPYSPNLNMIEELWRWLKDSVINNVFFDSVQKIRKAVAGFIKHINQTRENTRERLCMQY